jgi:hypothetical protein
MNYTQEANGWVSASDLTKEEYKDISRRMQEQAMENINRAQIRPTPEPLKVPEVPKLTVEKAAELLGLPVPKSHVTASSPKARDSSHKVPVNLCPASAIIAIALVIAQGHKKPGRSIYNWRTQPISLMDYLGATQRHLLKSQDGSDFDEELSELASDGKKDCQGNWRIQVRHDWAAMSCLAIIEDARQAGTLIDDRPTKGGAEKFLDILQTLKENK